MALVLADRVRDTTTTTGTGTVTLSGTAPTGYQTFGAAIGNTNTTYYTINAGSQWEVGIGTYSSTGPTLARTTVLASSNSGSLVDFSTGTKDVFVTYPSGKSVNQDASGNVGIGTTAPASKLDIATGDLRFSGTGQRILGDFSNATFTSRVCIQTTTTSSSTGVSIIPSAAGAGLNASLNVESDPTFAAGSLGQFVVVSGSEVRLTSGIRGTGTYLPMTFYTNGSERMRLDTSGNFGIGTSSPTSKLDVNGKVTLTGGEDNQLQWTNNSQTWRMNNSTGGQIYLYNVTSTRFPFKVDAATASDTLCLTSTGVGIGATAPQGKLDVQSRSSGAVTTGLVLDNRVANSVNTGIDLRFYVNDGGDARYAAVRSVQSTSGNYADLRFLTSASDTPTERMRITPDGNVGINTTAPGHKLEVITNSTANIGFRVQNQSTSQFAGSGILCSGPSAAGTQGAVAFYYYNANAGGTNGTMAISQFSYDGTFQRQLANYDFNSQFWAFTTNGSERMRIVSGGAIGMGTSTPNASLHVQGSRGGEGRMTQISTSAGSATDALNIMASSSSGGSDQWYSWGVTSGNVWRICPGVGLSSSQAFSINSNSRVLVGSATTFDVTVGADLMVTGTAGSAAAFYVGATTTTQMSFYDSSQSNRVGWIGTGGSSTSFNTTSDRRLKQNIQPVGDVGDKIDQIEIVSHQWRNGTDTIIPYGVIAQDLYEVAPHAVTKGDEGEEIGLEWGVDYSKLVPMLVKEIQSLRARVAQLEGK